MVGPATTLALSQHCAAFLRLQIADLQRASFKVIGHQINLKVSFVSTLTL